MVGNSTILHDVSPEDLKNMIQSSIREELSKIALNIESKPAIPEPEQPISMREAIQFLGKSRQTLADWRRKGLITAHKLGGRLYFFKSELIGKMK